MRVKEVTAIEAMRSRSWVAVVALRANALRLHGDLIDQPCYAAADSGGQLFFEPSRACSCTDCPRFKPRPSPMPGVQANEL